MLKNNLHFLRSALYNPCQRMAGVLLFFSIQFIFTSCKPGAGKQTSGSQPGDRKVARIFDRDIYFSELKPFVQTDSAAMAAAYLNKITLEEALLRKAEDADIGQSEDIETKVRDFKNSLILLEYQKEYQKKNLDTIITDESLETYYREHINSFHLHSDIFKGYYIKVPANTPKLDKLRKMLETSKPADTNEIKSFCLRYSGSFLINPDYWAAFPTIVYHHKKFNSQELQQYAKNRQVITYEKEDDLYLVRLLDFKPARDKSPFEYCKPEIKQIILNKRRIDTWAKYNEQVLNEARSNHHIEIFK